MKAGATLANAISTDGRRVLTTRAIDSMVYEESGRGNVWRIDFSAGM